jgi:predicted MFS family arabinose efflux permease
VTSGTVRVRDATVRAATRATYTAFAGAGFAFASWASRIPQIRDRLQLDPSELGLVLLALAAGSVLALPVSGPVIARVGSRRTVTAMALLLGLALVAVAAGQLIGVAPVVVGLFLLGFSNGAWDVAMNVQCAAVERRLGGSIMSRFHAGFSLGTVAGAVIGAVMVTLHVAVTPHLIAAAVPVTLAVVLEARHFVADRDGAAQPARLADPGGARPAQPADHGGAGPAEARGGAAEPGLLTAWREPRTLLIGVFVLAFAFAEGAGNDWISVAVIDGYGLSAAVGTLAFAGFLAAMTAGRWFGPGLLDRYGRVPVVRVLGCIGIAGLLLFVFAPSTPLAFAGTLLWGLGTSLGFPVGMSAGADDPERAAGRVSVIASIGYCAFLGGPPLVGFLGDHVGVLRALTTVAVLLSLAALIAGALRPPATARPTTPVARG